MAVIKRDKNTRKKIRKFRIRKKVCGTNERPRLVLHKTVRYLYAQIIDDSKQCTLIGGSTLSPELRKKCKSAKNCKAAKILGTYIGEKAREKGITAVVFDRNGRMYHGCVKSFADAAREGGLTF